MYNHSSVMESKTDDVLPEDLAKKEDKAKGSKKESPKESLTEQKVKKYNTPDNFVMALIVKIFLFIIVIIIGTKALELISGTTVTGEPWYFLLVAGCLVIYGVGWLEKKTTYTPLAKIGKTIAYVGIFILIINGAWGVFFPHKEEISVKSLSELIKEREPKTVDFKFYKAGDELTVNLEEGEILDHYIRHNNKKTRIYLKGKGKIDLITRGGKIVTLEHFEIHGINDDFLIRAIKKSSLIVSFRSQ